MSILVVSKFLFLLSDIDSYLNCLLDVSDSSIKLKCPLWLFRLIIDLTKKIVHKFMCKSFDLNFSDHFNHIRYHLFALCNVKLQSFVILLTLFVMLGSSAPLRFTFIVLSNSQMLIRVLLISLKNYFGILIHHLVRLSDNECFLPLSTKDQELDSFLFEASSFAILSYH